MTKTAHAPEVFSEAALQQVLQPLGIALELVARTASTNTDLLLRARKQTAAMPAQLLRVAQEQTAGRGRFERRWVTTEARALTFSYGCKWQIESQGFAGLPLVVGLAIAQALATLDVDVQLKWPNDILFQGRKLAGILVESVINDHGAYVVIGVGINLELSSHARLHIAQRVADLHEALSSSMSSRKDNTKDNAIPPMLAQHALLAIMPVLHDQLERFRREGFVAFNAAWNQAHAFQGKPVQLLDGDTVIATGIARGVDEYGQLLLETPAGMRRLRSGDISLRPL